MSIPISHLVGESSVYSVIFDILIGGSRRPQDALDDKIARLVNFGIL